MPTVSVVIPAKNRAKMIGRCLDSVLNQTVKADEIIVVDDNSTDNTKEIVQSYQQYGVKYIPLENKTGAQAARNLGIISANSDFIAFQDSDDEWFDYKLEKQIKIITNSPYSNEIFVHGDCIIFDHLTGERRDCKVRELNGNCHENLLMNPGPLFPSFIVSKKKMIEIGMLDEKVLSSQEWDTAIMISKSIYFYHIQEPLFIYNKHNNETISKNYLLDIEGYDYIVNKHKNDILLKLGKNGILHHLRRQISLSKEYKDWAVFEGKGKLYLEYIEDAGKLNYFFNRLSLHFKELPCSYSFRNLIRLVMFVLRKRL